MAERDGDALQKVGDRARDDVAELRASKRRLVLAADADRKWLERELHDGVNQHLVALAVDLQLVRRLAVTDADGARLLLDRMEHDVQRALDELALLAQRLHPTLVGAGGLGAVLRAVATNAGTPASVDVRVDASYPPEVVSTVYRACLVVLGRANARVALRDRNRALAFDLTANGDWSAEIEGLRDRVEALDGSLTVESRDDGSTRAFGALPLP